jgi:hypothetical protein
MKSYKIVNVRSGGFTIVDRASGEAIGAVCRIPQARPLWIAYLWDASPRCKVGTRRTHLEAAALVYQAHLERSKT